MSGSLGSSIFLIETWAAPKDTVFMVSDKREFSFREGGPAVIAHPATAMMLRHGGRTPFWTRHMSGVKEAERDRRKA